VFRHKGKTRLLSGRCGSLPYVAPEVSGACGSERGVLGGGAGVRLAEWNSWVDRRDRAMRRNQLISGGWAWCSTHCLSAVSRDEPSTVAWRRRVGGTAYRPDTPWDEPSENSPEFNAFLTGELLNYDPWTRIRGQARGGSLLMKRRSG
jgi:serine/threonine-protein kinase Chk1